MHKQQEGWDKEGTYRIDVLQGVKRQASQPLCRGIAKLLGHPPMRDLVDRDGKQQRQEYDGY
jgi:hypothetical protein